MRFKVLVLCWLMCYSMIPIYEDIRLEFAKIVEKINFGNKVDLKVQFFFAIIEPNKVFNAVSPTI